MERLTAEAFKNRLRFFGRCYDDAARSAVYFNWTMSGFEVRFEGAVLDAEFEVIPVKPDIPKFAQTENSEPPLEYPCIGVFADGAEEPGSRIELSGDGKYRLYEGEEGVHTVRVLKLSEGMHGQNGLLAVGTDGTFLEPAAASDGLHIEFIGDSITCGFGNESAERTMFRTAEENGWMTYGAIAARRLGAGCGFICVAGIAVSKGKRPWEGQLQIPAMEAIYEYTDSLYEKNRGITEGRRWDFASARNDVVVINLGTNDHNVIRFCRDMERNAEERAYFIEHYREFLKLVRRCNPAAFICCCLGPVEHYMFDNIREAAAAYTAETGDNNLVCFKFDTISPFGEGMGGGGHPSVKTHERMADELVWLIKNMRKGGQIE